MHVPGLGIIKKPIAYTAIAFFLFILVVFVIYPLLPTPNASYSPDSKDSSMALVSANEIGSSSLVCPSYGPKKNLRCATINNNKLNYDHAIVQDFVYFVDILKKKLYGAPTYVSFDEANKSKKPSTFIIDIGAHVGFFSFSLANSFADSSSSSSSSGGYKIMSVDASSENKNAMEKTKQLATDTTNNFKNVIPLQAALHNQNTGGGGDNSNNNCYLASEETDVNDFSLICQSSSLDIGAQVKGGSGDNSKVLKVRSAVDSSTPSSLEQIFSPDEYTSASVRLVKIDVGNPQVTMSAIKSSHKTFFGNSNYQSYPQVIALRVTKNNDDSGGDASKLITIEELLRYVAEKYQYTIFLPANRTIVPPRDFGANFFDEYSTFPPMSTTTQVTIYLVRGDVSYFLLCNEINVPLMIGIIAVMIFISVAYIYFLNAQARKMYDMKRQMGGAAGGLAAFAGLSGAPPGSMEGPDFSSQQQQHSGINVPPGMAERLAQIQSSGRSIQQGASNSMGMGMHPGDMMSMLDFGPQKKQ